LLSGITIIAILIIAAVFVYPKIFKRDKLENLISPDGRIPVAVMPFRNMTNDTILNVWQDGIKDNLITYLSNYSEDLAVRQIESINGLLQNKGLANYASITPSVASSISRKLDANVFISGSISQAGPTIRVNAQLINSKTEEAFQSFQIEGTSEEEIFQIIDSLSVLVKDFLIISVMEREIITDFRWLISTGSAEAYRFYNYGNKAFYKLDWPTARDWYLKATEKDTNFTEALRMLSYTYGHLGMGEEAKKTSIRLYRKKDQMSSIQEKIWADVVYSGHFETPYEKIKYLGLLRDLDDQMPVPYSMMAGPYESLHQYEKAISLREKELEIYDKWGSRPRWSASYTSLGGLYHQTGQYRKERKLYRKAQKDFPDDYSLLYRQAILALAEDHPEEANRYIEKYISARKVNIASEAAIASDLAEIYSGAGLLDKAEEYYQEALSLQRSAGGLNNLARFLIDNEIDINEGLKFVDEALGLSPDNFNYLDTKAWGLYKQGKYEEAKRFIEKADSLKLNNYNYTIFIHKQEIEKAIQGQ